MYCVIQKVKRKKTDPYGTHKEIIVTTTIFSLPGQGKRTSYGYTYSDERFERPILDAYKISIHHSYRENGKVKKKQWPICTMGYYELIEYSLYDFADRKIKELADEMDIGKEEIYDMIYKKLDPIIEEVEAEFQQTEEYKAKQEQERLLTLHEARRIEFEEEYGQGEYKYCYDVFGKLRNPEYLEQLKVQKRASEEYRRQSYEEQQKRFEEYFKSGGSSYSSYSISSRSNYTDEEKQWLREIYRMASKKFHPDVCGDDGSKMKFLTRLKDEWGL